MEDLKMDVFEAIRDMIAERNDKDPAEITLETKFKDLGIDSLDTVEMLMDLGDQLDAEIELEEPVETVGELVDFIKGKLGE